eukprot:s2492_g11.t1
MPSLQEFIEEDNLWPLLPLPFPEVVQWKPRKSCRLRARQKFRLQAWRVSKGMVKTINALHYGFVESSSLTALGTGAYGGRMKVTDARSLALQRILARGAAVARARRDCRLTGVRDSVAALLKAPLDDQGYLRLSTVKQVPMIAHLMVEPDDTNYVNMLEVLPPEDASYYALEENVIERCGKSEILFKEIEAHYGFIGGTLEEYLKYLKRPDVQHLWNWGTMDEVQAIAGISTVLKKDGIHQRKLIMQVASNYAFQDLRERAHLGMGGGSSLARCFVEGDCMSIAACDEDSAFTYVKVPEWMTAWQAGPPVLASQVWELLQPELQRRIPKPSETYVAPKYMRLAMGGSHSVYLLMRINLYHIGKTLFNYGSTLSLKPEGSMPSADQQSVLSTESAAVDTIELDDDDWVVQHDTLKNKGVEGANYSVDQWCEAVRETKRRSFRSVVIMHMFAGERRAQDVQECLEAMLANQEPVLMLSVDLAADPLWDFTNPCTFHSIMQLAREGLIDIWLGGPPCSTVARSRHAYFKGGPRPLRFRWCVWGRADLTWSEQRRVDEANRLWINFWAVADEVCSHGGAYLLEHPADPECDPYPSIWILPEVLGLEARSGAKRALIHQCPFGGIAPKLTCLSGNVRGLMDIDGVRCPGVSDTHQHGMSIGRNPEGGFYTRRLQTYPPGLCLEIARMLYETLSYMLASNTGPTGALKLEGERSAPSTTNWSTSEHTSRYGIVMLNEATSRRTSTLVNPHQAAVYVHVDDTVCIGSGKRGPLHADTVLEQVVGGLCSLGFRVTQQYKTDQLDKVVGYEVNASPAEFRLPFKKMVALRTALLGVASQKKVNVAVLRSLIGIWIFGALLKRELLSIPHSIFHFLEDHEESGDSMLVHWWESARREVRAMGMMVPLMVLHVGSPIVNWLFATDAMGANPVDFGGYGIAVTQISRDEVQCLLRQGEATGKSVALGSQGVLHPEKPLQPTVPFTTLPDRFFEPGRWLEVEHGRWAYGDHITIGEARTVLKLVQKLGKWPQLHGHAAFSLQDNQPTACSMAKGRSPSFQLNRILRKKAATTLAADLHLRARVSADTFEKYRKALEPFIEYLNGMHDLRVQTPEDLDFFILEYRTENDLTRSQQVLLVAAIEFFLPHVKGKLLVSRESLKGRLQQDTIQHTVPLTLECTYLFSAYHASRGLWRLGAAIAVQQGTGLKPSELLGLEPGHVHVPVSACDSITLRLGAVRSTKVKREQYVIVNPQRQTTVYRLLKHVHAKTVPGHRLFPFSYAWYNRSFKDAEKYYKLVLGTTAHSPRAGFATTAVLNGEPHKEIQTRGRWLSETSFHTYIDVASAAHIKAQISSQQLEQTALWIERRFWSYFPEVPTSYEPQADRFHRADELRPTTARSEAQPQAPLGSTIPQHGPRARAEVIFGSAMPSRARSSTRRHWNWWAVLKRWSQSWPVVCFLVMTVVGSSNGLLWQFARLLGVAAELGESSTIVAAHALNFTTTVAASATDILVSATTNGLSTADNLWRGVDITNVISDRCRGQLLLQDAAVLQHWLATPDARILVPCLDDSLEGVLQAAVNTVANSMPGTQTQTEHLDLGGRFGLVQVAVSKLDHGHLRLEFESVNMTFQVAWSNPVWSHLNWDVETERTQVLFALKQLLLDLPSTSPSTNLPVVKLEFKPHLALEVRALLQAGWRLGAYGLTAFSSAMADSYGWVGAFVGSFVAALLCTLWVCQCFWAQQVRPGLSPICDGRVSWDDASETPSVGSFELLSPTVRSEAPLDSNDHSVETGLSVPQVALDGTAMPPSRTGVLVFHRSPSASRPCGGEGLRRDLLAFYDRHDDALADLIIHINEGAVVANMALVEARLPALLSSAEALGEADPALLVDDRGRRGSGPGLHQVRLSGVSRATLVQLLRWAYGEAVPAVGGEDADALSLSVAFDLLEACSKFEVERLETLLRETLLESLDLPKFASVLRESHVRQIPGLKQGCMRFALHNFDQLVDHPELFMKELSELPEVVSDLFRLGRVWKDAEEGGGPTAARRTAPAVPSTLVSDLSRLFDVARQEEREDDEHRSPRGLAPDCRVVVGEEMFLAHSVILSARSDFFKAAFSSDMVERNSLMVTLQHYRGDRPGRDAMLAILYFLYTGKTSKVTGSIAMDVLCLLGAEGQARFEKNLCLGALSVEEVHALYQPQETIDFCRKHGIVVEAYSPLGGGSASNAARASDGELDGTRLLLTHPSVQKVSEETGKTTAQDFIVIPRSSKPARIQENFDIFDFELSEEHMRNISEVGEAGQKFCWDPKGVS